MTSRTNRELTQSDIDRIAATVHAWRANGEVQQSYEDVPGFCYSAKLEEIEKNGFVLTPGRYVGAAEQEEDGELFSQKMKRLKDQYIQVKDQQDRLSIELVTFMDAVIGGGK